MIEQLVAMGISPVTRPARSWAVTSPAWGFSALSKTTLAPLSLFMLIGEALLALFVWTSWKLMSSAVHTAFKCQLITLEG